MRVIPLMVAGLIMAGQAAAGDLPIAPPSPLIEPGGGGIRATQPLANSFSLGPLSGNLGYGNDLKKLTKLIGVGRIGDLSKQDDPYVYVCYDIPQTRQRVWLISSDNTDIGDAVDTITEKSLEPTDPKLGACPNLPAKYQPLLVDKVLRLGMRSEDLVKRFGKPGRIAGDWMSFSYPDDGIVHSLVVRLQNGVVVFLDASSININ